MPVVVADGGPSQAYEAAQVLAPLATVVCCLDEVVAGVDLVLDGCGDLAVGDVAHPVDQIVAGIERAVDASGPPGGTAQETRPGSGQVAAG